MSTIHITENTAARFLARFSGYEHAHLTYETGSETPKNNGKLETRYRTIKNGATVTDVVRHLRGEQPLAISPIRENGECSWGVVDVDQYGMSEDDFSDLKTRLFKFKIAVVRSKSGGAHIPVFSDVPVPAIIMQDCLKYIARALKKGTKYEIFPKQLEVRPGDTPSPINLPYYGSERHCVAYSDGARTGAMVETENNVDLFLSVIDNYLTHTSTEIEGLAARYHSGERNQPVRQTDVGYKEPEDAAGRNEHLYKTGCSMRARGAEMSEIEAVLQDMNRQYAEANHPLWVGKGELEQDSLKATIKSISTRPQGTRTDLHFDMVNDFNQRFAVLRNGHKVEIILKDARPAFVTMSPQEMLQWTANERVRIGKAYAPIFRYWMQDCDRLQYDGVVFESDYNGAAYNLWNGYGVEPVEGNIDLFLEYINTILASGDLELGRWIIHWLAHAVQNPTRPSVPTALVLCGPQGQGKSHILRLMQAILPHNTIEIADAKNRFLGRFNRELIGNVFVGAEEAIFSGDVRFAQILKTFISAGVWQYEAKYGATISLTNIHRLIATTNQLHASQIDADDRRMTIVYVPQRWNLSSADGYAACRAYWSPHFSFLETGGPALLHYLLNIKVDVPFISVGYTTAAKVSDKIESNPLLELLVDFGETGIIPFDTNGVGVISSENLHELLTKRSNRRSYMLPTRNALAKHLKEFMPCESVRNADYIEVKGVDRDGQPNLLVQPNRRGIQFPNLADFRKKLEDTIGPRDWGQTACWQPWVIASTTNTSFTNDDDVPF